MAFCKTCGIDTDGTCPIGQKEKGPCEPKEAAG